MGGKHQRRKTVWLVTGICAVFFAVASVLLGFVGWSFNRDDANPVAAATPVTVGNSHDQYTPGSYTFNFEKGPNGEDPVYFVEFAGANGGGGTGGWDGMRAGYGAVDYAFYQGTSLHGYIYGYTNRADVAAAEGGGYTRIQSNFAINNNARSGYSYAAGGGGATVPQRRENQAHSHTDPDTDSLTWESKYIEKKELGNNTRWYKVDRESDHCISAETVANINYTPGDAGWGVAGGHILDNYDESGSVWGFRACAKHDHTFRGDDHADAYLKMNMGRGGYGYNNGDWGNFTKKNSGTDPNRWTISASFGMGGTSSPNCYPRYVYDSSSVNAWGGSRSTGQGWIKLRRLTPAKYPSSAAYIGDGKTAYTFNSGTTMSDSLYSGLCSTYYEYCYRTRNDDGKWSSWSSWSTTKPTRTATGITEVQWRYMMKGPGGTNRVSSSGHQIATGAVTITVRGAGIAGTLNLSNYTYTGEPHQIVTTAPSGSSTGATIYYAIYYAEPDKNGKVHGYALYSGENDEYASGSVGRSNDNLAWTSDRSVLPKPTDVGTYYVYWYASAVLPNPAQGITGNTESNVSWAKVTINRTTPTWGDLAKNQGTLKGVNPVYNGRQQALFAGTPVLYIKNNAGRDADVYATADVYYAMTTDPNTKPTDDGVKDLTSLQIKDVDQKTYYLWARTQTTNNLNAQDWHCFGEYTASKMQMATIAAAGVAVNSPSSRAYNGRETTFVNGTPITNREADIPLNYTADVGKVQYTRLFTPADEIGKTEPQVSVLTGDTLAEVNIAKDAGLYQLVISWAGSGNVAAGETRFQYYTVNKATSNIDLGFSLNIPYNVTLPAGGVALVTGGWLECIMAGNGSTEAIDVIDGANNYASFYWTQDASDPDLTDPDVAAAFVGPIGGALGTSVMQSLYNHRVYDAGRWYLWIKFDHHANIADDTLVRYGFSVYVNPVPVDQLHLEDQDGGLHHNDAVPFDGQAHQVASGNFIYAERYDDAGRDYVVIDERDVEYSICNTRNERLAEWTHDLADLKVITYGDYFLMVRWGWSTDGDGNPLNYEHHNVANTGRDGIRLYNVGNYQPFQIKTKTNFDDLVMAGLPVNSQSGKMFDNVPLRYTEASPENKLEFYIAGNRLKDDYKGYFGILNYALSTDNTVPPSSDQFTATMPATPHAGEYYLWLWWSGDGGNIGSAYQVYSLTETLVITKAVQENIQIDNIVALSAAERTFAGYGIPLFGYENGDTAILRVKDQTPAPEPEPEPEPDDGADGDGETEPTEPVEPEPVYNEFTLLDGEMLFALTVDAEYAPGDARAWSTTLAGAVQTWVHWNDADHTDANNVGEYHLWVKIVGDNNVYNSVYYIGGAKLELREAYADYAPTPMPSLSYIDGKSQVLITGSLQNEDPDTLAGIKPYVEYRLYKDGQVMVDWTRDSNAIKAMASGTYYVFYRGSRDDNHREQDPNFDLEIPSSFNTKIGYHYVVVQLNPATLSIAVIPESMNAVYTGKPQMFFKQGFGKIPGNDRLPLVYAVFDEQITVAKLRELMSQTGLMEASAVNESNFFECLNLYLHGGNNESDENYPGRKFVSYASVPDLMRTDAKTYTVYYKAAYNKDLQANPVQMIQISISRTNISISDNDLTNPNFLKTSDNPESDLYVQYKAADYQVIRSSLIFSLNGTGGLTNQSTIIGQPGLVQYGIVKYTPGSNLSPHSLKPTVAESDYLSLAVRDAGVYYLYYRVWAGDNHNGTGGTGLGIEPAWVCFNPENPIYINQADSSVVDLSWSLDTFGPEVRFNGQPLALVTTGQLVQSIEGHLVTDTIGRVWYAVTDSPDSPAAGSLVWQSSYLSSTQIYAGRYYLHVKVEESANLTQLIGCVNPNNPIILGKANDSDLGITGITVYDQMYNGGRLNLAVGNLQVNTVQRNRVITANILPEVVGYYQYTRYNDAQPQTDWPTEQGLAAATMLNGFGVGEYYLWVKIPASDNTEEVIKLVNVDPVSITPADENNIYIVTPLLAEGIEYNGQPRNLILGEASLALRSGYTLSGIRGDAYYLVSQDSRLPDVNDAGWLPRYDAIQATDRGVYYVFVKYVANAGSNHTDLQPVLAGQVEITQAGVNTLILGGILYGDPQTYNGTSRPVAYGNLTLDIPVNGNLVSVIADAGAIRYAWSNSDKILPDVEDAEWKTNLQDLLAVNAGEYYLWVWVAGGENIAEFRTCLGIDDNRNQYMLIKQASAEVVKLSGVEAYAPHLVYSGAPQQLAKGALVQKIAGNVVTSGRVMYGLGSGTNRGQEPQMWYSSLDQILATNATDVTKGEAYYLWVSVEESANIAAQTTCLCSIVIDRAQTYVTDIQGAAGLVYYQGDQRLLAKPGTANFGEVVYRLADAGDVHDANDWLSDWRDVVGQNAGKYTIYYAVIDNPNWQYCSYTMEVYINPATAPFSRKPTAQTYLFYNETPQDLVDFGELLPQATEQDCAIKFRYQDEDNGIWYTYYGDGRWDELGKLPGRTEAGEYTVLYYTTGGKSGNYLDETAAEGFEPHELTVTISRREIFWLARPEPRYGLKNIATTQILLTAGQLSAQGILGGTIEYTLDKNDDRSWSTDLPKGMGEQIFYCWYRVRFDAKNNYFLDGDVMFGENSAAGVITSTPQVVQVLMEKMTLSFRGEPQGVTVTYDATDQVLVWGGELSTFDLEDVDTVYIDYSFDGGDTWLGQGNLPTASKIGTYTITYEVKFNHEVFEFIGGDYRGEITSTVMAAVITGNEIRATIEIDEDNNYTIGFDQGNYTDDFGTELSDIISYRFRRRDAYFTDDAWHPWAEFDKNQIGTYEIQAIIDPEAGDGNANVTNFTSYEQTENFETFVIAKDLVVNIEVREKTAQPLLRVWVDLTGNMSYADSPFRSVEYLPLDKDRIVLHGVNSPGKNGAGVIRVSTVNDSYYYLSATVVNHKMGIQLAAENTDKAVLALNPGLDATHDIYTVYLYEVYKISYNANTGTGSLSDGWKWHDVAYELAENNFEKTGLVADGWSRYPNGSGERYRKGAMFYTINASQIFYAQFAGENEQTVVVRWKVGNYEISSTGDEWFDTTLAENKTHERGITYVMYDQIYLPDLSKIPELATNNRCVMSWYRQDTREDYHWGITVDKLEIVFEAVLSGYSVTPVTIEFLSDGITVRTTAIANGARSYLALSGLTANDFKRYNYQKFVDDAKYKDKTFSSTVNPLQYELGAELSADEPPIITPPSDSGSETAGGAGDTTAMIIIIVIGLVIAVVMLVVYLLLRNRKLKINLHGK